MAEVRVTTLGSGSSGNAYLVEMGAVRLLVDAGFSSLELERRLRSAGCSPAGLSAVLLTHEHGDHAKGAGVFCATHRRPLVASPGTHRALGLDPKAVAAVNCHPRRPVLVGDCTVRAVAVSHDAAEPVGYVLEAGGERVAILHDLGVWGHRLAARVGEVDMLLIEANHDGGMLRRGPYPAHLQRRILGKRGHLSNGGAAAAVRELLCDRLRSIVLCHLSRRNNRPDAAKDAVGGVLMMEGSAAALGVAERGVNVGA